MAGYRPLIASALAVAACGCNAAFGLVRTDGPDSDGDGQLDTSDNCRAVANEDQANRDGDALGDACDPCDGPQTGQDTDGDGIDDACDACPVGANSDEDGDGAPDGCDACPGETDDQLDDDGDGVGNVCDPDPGVQNHRVFFDGFDPPRDDWRAWLAEWRPMTGALVPTSSYGGPTGAWNPAAAVTGDEWVIEAAIDTPPSPSGGDYVGLYILKRDDGANIENCSVTWDPGGWHASEDTFQIVTLGSTFRVRFHAHGSADDCTVDGASIARTSNLPLPADSYVGGLATGLPHSFRWIDVVSR